MLGHKDSLGKFKKIKILSSIFSDHNAMRLEINYKKKSPTRWKWVWASSGSWWWTGKPGMLQSVGLQRVKARLSDWLTRKNKKYKHRAVKQHATKPPLEHWKKIKEIKKYLEKNESTTVQNLWDASKEVLRGKSIAIQHYLKKQEKSQINNLTLQTTTGRKNKT